MNTLKAQLTEGRPVTGILSPSFDPVLVEMIGQTSYDYFMIEGEHGMPSGAQISEVCRAAEISGITPMARVSHSHPKLILQYIEGGMKGLMLPGVTTLEEVETFISSIKFPPFGVRGLGGARSTNYLMDGRSIEEITKVGNDEVLSIVQIETKAAYEQTDEIIAIPGIDIIFVGEVDLSLSLGLPYKGAKMNQITAEIALKCKEANIPVGVISADGNEIAGLVDQGINFLLTPLSNVISKGTAAYSAGKNAGFKKSL